MIFAAVILVVSFLTLLTYHLANNKLRCRIKNDKNIVHNATVDGAENFVVQMKASKKSMIIFYGSQTGTAEGFANRLGNDARKYGIGALVVDPGSFDFDSLTELQANIDNPLILVFCVATYGEGDPTDNAHDLFEWLSRSPKLGIDLSGVNYAVFGLGNKTYENYNAFGKFVDKQMEKMQAYRICEIGLGDDDANIEVDFVTWSERFWEDVSCKFGISLENENKPSRQFCLSELKVFSGEPARLGSFECQRPPYGPKNPFLATIIEKRELHKGGDRSCLHLELDIRNSCMRYEAGDHIAVFPKNDPELVLGIARRLNFDLERVFSMDNVDPEAAKRNPFPCPTSYSIALSHYLDITSPLRSNVLREFAEYATVKSEKAFLRLLGSSTDEGRAKYAEWILADERDFLAILEELPSLKPPIDLVCELLPRLQPRYYSIASSPKVYPTSIHITTVIVQHITNAGRLRHGVCTNYLRNRPVGGKVAIFVRRSQFRLPFRTSTPVIMVGPGTGLAPFRGFLQDRCASSDKGKDVGENVLYFGCRRPDEDFIYEEELVAWQRDGTLSQLNVAFSRRERAFKVYVQHLIRRNSPDIWRLVDSVRGHVYVCGDGRRMARDVYEAFVDVLCQQGQMERATALDYMKRLSKEGRYSTDVWA